MRQHALEEFKLLREDIVNPLVGGILRIQQIDCHNIMFLPVTMATADTLLNLHRVPRQVIIDYRVAELKV